MGERVGYQKKVRRLSPEYNPGKGDGVNDSSPGDSSFTTGTVRQSTPNPRCLRKRCRSVSTGEEHIPSLVVGGKGKSYSVPEEPEEEGPKLRTPWRGAGET